ncbi:MAG: L-threonylcarbamoyladenylate synthase [Bacteroidales bacterium]|nr:L-threonylcarbamoyladenylate synthase [Bacteroidales bacterium]MDT8430230.1 L-threonylcarbamoyladenylate synthase [Bacteroidales bacterium]
MNDDINKALEVLRNGGVILYPTDTIWGIGCDATNAEAVKRIYGIKEREDSKSMLVLVHNEAMLPAYVGEMPEVAWELLEAATEPMTIIYPGAKNLAPNLVGADGTIGIRVTSDAFCTQLISRFKKPIVSTSANISGKPSPANFDEVDPVLHDKVDYVVNWRQDDLARAKPSSVIKLGPGGEIEILRK